MDSSTAVILFFDFGFCGISTVDAIFPECVCAFIGRAGGGELSYFASWSREQRRFFVVGELRFDDKDAEYKNMLNGCKSYASGLSLYQFGRHIAMNK